MEVILTVLILLLIVLLIYKSTEISSFLDPTGCVDSFVLTMDANPGPPIKLGEQYAYPSCSGCLNMTGQLKPYFAYDISDVRCVKNRTNQYINNADMLGILNYSLDPALASTNITGCTSVYNSLYSTVIGRYVKLQRTGTTAGFQIGHISVHARPYANAPYSAFIYVNSIFKDTTGVLQYPNTILNSASYQTFKTADADSGFVIIDLGTNYEIGFVDIYDITGTSVSDAMLYVLNDPASSPTTSFIISDTANVVFHQAITYKSTTGPYLHRIFTYNKPVTIANKTQTVFETYMYPSCTGCLTNYSCTGPGACLIKGYKYNTTDGRCFRSITFGTPSNILDLAVSKSPALPISDYNKYFITCGTSTTTPGVPSSNSMVTIPFGRYVRIQNKTKGQLITLVSFEARTPSNTGSSVFMPPIDVHVRPYSIGQSYNILYLTNTGNTTAISTGADPNYFSYIQLDVSQGTTYDLPISDIYIKGLSASVSTLTNSMLYIIKDDGTVTYQYDLGLSPTSATDLVS